MCGIVAYTGLNNALPILLEGLRRLEYRGYDSAGIFMSNTIENKIYKVKGKVIDLRRLSEKKEAGKNYPIGMGHTRWATHGKPNEINSHPHLSNNQELVLIHNGIIENYETLKKDLIQRGYNFHSDTDYINFNPNINFLIVNIIGVSLGMLVPGISLYFSKVNE